MTMSFESAGQHPEHSSRADTEEVLYHSDRTRVVRTRLSNGQWAVVKEPRGGTSAARIRHELLIIERLSGVDGIPRLMNEVARPGTIEIEDTGGVSLVTAASASPPDAGQVVDLALAVTRTLAAMHRRGVVHKDINPNNIVVCGSPWRPTLIDFDIASTFAEDRPAFTHASQIDGTLAYIAPEQTGRTGRGVDLRADLYSLGATLYALATGRPPFPDGDPLQLIHAHVAQIPESPAVLNPRLPTMLCRIILRLLEKDPDRRYQSADGLMHDLARLAADLGRGAETQFDLCQRDFPLKLTAPSRLIGRDAETAVLHDAFDEVRSGARSAVFIRGAPGVGKTALIDELKSVVTARRGWFVTGKFDQYRADADADGVRQALRTLGRMLLAEPEAQLAEHRARILDAVGPNAGLVAGVLPEFEVLLEVKPVATVAGDPLEAEARIVQAGIDVLRAVASPEHPVVIVLDDLQWAGATPIGVVDAVVMDDSLAGLLLVGAYRDAEVGPTHPLTPKLTRWQQMATPPREISLNNLSAAGLGALLMEMLRLGPKEAGELADSVEARTSGNPFDTVELINGLRRDGVLVVGEGGWTWDASTIRGYIGQGDVVDLIAARIGRLPADAQAVLQVIACLGGEVDLDLLGSATELSAPDLDERLIPPLEDGLLVLQRGAPDTVRFRHDRIQQAAQGTLEAGERAVLHLALARRLADRSELQAVAAEQYLAAVADVSDPDELRRAAMLFRVTAANVRLINPAMAERFLAAATEMLDTVEPADSDLLIALDVERHAMLYVLGRLDDIDRVYAGIRARGASPLALAEAARVQIPSLSVRNRSPEAVDLGLDLLRRLGQAVPRAEQVGIEIERGLDALYHWAHEDTESAELQRAEVTDPHAVAIAGLINCLMPAAYYSGDPIMAWLVVEARRLWSERGPCAALVGPICHAGFVTIVVREDYRTGYLVVRRLLAMSEARGYEPQTSQARFLFSLGSGHWFEALDGNAREAQRAHEGLVRRGDLLNAIATGYASMPQLLDSAATIDSYLADVEAGLAAAVRAGNDQAAAAFVAYRQLGRALRGETRIPGGFDDDNFDEAALFVSVAGNPTAGANAHATRALAAAAFGDVDALTRHAAATVPLRPFIPGTYTMLTSHLVQALALAYQVRLAEWSPRDELLAEFAVSRDWLAKRAEEAPANFTHLVRLVEAERAWALGDHWTAVREFENAMRQAQSGNHGWQTAFIIERAAHLHLACGLAQTGRALLADARCAYEAWGATGKVSQLDQEHPFLRTMAAPKTAVTGRSGTVSVSTDAIDMLGILAASQALSSETSLDRLQVRVGETLSALAGATAVRLVLFNDESQEWFLPEGNGASIPLEEAGARGLVPLSAVRYAERTREPLLVEDATADHRFARDQYVTGLDSCSLLIVPVIARGVLRAMLVLENRLSRGAFSAKRFNTVMLIAGQLAVSIDNAMVYASLEQKVAARTEELAEANLRLEQLAITDPLTGLPNRRRLSDVLEAEWLRGLRSGEPIALAMIDIDHFKKYNDHYGHQGGDECLRLVARTIKGSARITDLVARYGGEEFCIVMPSTDTDGARLVAERVCQAVADLREPHAGTDTAIVTISVGLTAAIPAAGLPDQLIKIADQALYEAKRDGRNRVATG